jgi:hypothetical protein
MTRVLAGGFDADTFVYLARAHAGREAAPTNCTWITTIPRAD